MTLHEEGHFGHVDGNPKSEEVVPLIFRLMFTLYEGTPTALQYKYASVLHEGPFPEHT